MAVVHRDETRGHFVLELVDTRHKREVIAVDLGPTLHLTTSGAHLTPDEARALADALTWWADRKHGGAEDLGRVIDVNDLFELIDEAP